jgi:hypothetical protein
MTDHSEGVFKMKTNSSVLSGKFWLAAVTVALFLLPFTAAAQAGNSGRDRIGNINRGRVGVVTTVEPGETLDLNVKLKIRSGGFFLENTALLRAGRDNRLIPPSPPFDRVVLGTENSSDYLVFNAGGVERARISPDGNFGIGTISPINGGNNARWLTIDGLSTYSGGVVYSVAGTAKGYTYYDNNINAMGVESASGVGLALKIGNSAALFVNTSGNVGIGTTNPTTKLSLGDTVSAVNNAGSKIAVYDNGSTFYGIGLGYYSSKYGIGLHAANGGFTASPQLFVNEDGNVGIGTTTPTIYGGGLEVSRAGQAAVRVSDTAASGKGVEIGADAVGGFIQTVSAGADLRFFTGNAATQVMYLTSGGYVGIGKNPTVALDVVGSINLTGTINAKYQDVAEWVPSSEQFSAGTVVVLDSTQPNQVTSSTVRYDTRVAGVVSEQPGIALGEKSDGKVLVATTGRVKVKVDASKGAIHIGDLLVTSDIPGVAMKSEAVNLGGVQFHRPGTLIGKALEPLEKGKGEILVLLSLQ